MISGLNRAARGRLLDTPCEDGPAVKVLIAWLDALLGIMDQYPPIKQPMRFGNKAFRDWHAAMLRESPELLAPLFSDDHKELVDEGIMTQIVAYASGSFGDLQRIDYGTGARFLLIYCCFACFNK
jgi:serine/threonine-protein phosphatase 2A activator